MAYTKYSLTPANNTAAPPDGAPEGMLPSAVNDTMRDMMAQIRDCGDGIRDGTYTMTAPKITGGTITGAAFTGNTFTSPVISGGTINNATIGATTANTGKFTTLEATGVATFSAGTVSAPAITTTGDTNTGIFFPAADTIAFTEGGVESMRIDASGNVGIGTTGGVHKLDVVGAGAQSIRVASSNGDLATLRMLSSGNNEWSIASDTVMRFRKDSTEYMRIDSSGKVGIGTTPTQVLDVSSSDSRFNLTSTGSGQTVGISIKGGAGGGSDFNFIESLNSSGTQQWYLGSNGTANTLAFKTNGNNERMRIDSSGNVGIGTTTTTSTLLNIANSAGLNEVMFRGTPYTNIFSETTNGVQFGISSTGSSAAIEFFTNNTERMRIDSSGNLLVGKTSTSGATAGVQLEPSGLTTLVRSGGVVLQINRLTSDGNLIDFYQDTALEGNISVSGTTVSYNGGHLSRWSQLSSGQKDNTLLKGTVMSNLDDMCVWVKDGETLPNEQLNKMKVSDMEGDTNVAGVFVNWTRDEQCNTDDMNVAMTGDMIIRIAEGVIVQKGDLLMSAGDGTAKPQGDDIVRSKTIAKVTSNHVTCTYADGSYCVPCVLMAC